MAPNNANEQQQLADEKLSISNNFNRHQQVNGASYDLVEQSGAPQPDDNGQRYGVQVNPMQRFVGKAGSVINGNHATYVEPPADFKPIIYDTNKESQYAQQQSKAIESSQSVLNEGPDFSQNQLIASIASSSLSPAKQQSQDHQIGSGVDPLMISSSGFSDFPASGQHRQQQQQLDQIHHNQQQQQHGYKRPASLAGASQDEIPASSQQADKVAAAANQAPLKPSIGRWTDWHDMSIEPDLASSDSSASFYSVQNSPGAVNLPPAPYRTRYRAAVAAAATKGAFALVPSQFSYAGVKDQKSSSVQQTGEQTGHQVSVKRQTGAIVQQQLQIKGGQQADQSSSAIKAAISTSGQPIKATKLPLKLISSSDATGKQSIKAQQVYQQQLSNEQHNQRASFWQQQPQQQQYFRADRIQALPGAQADDSASAKQPRRLKRRRKSKTNAEVRIQQLVTASQQQQQQQQQQHELLNKAGKQVNGLVVNQEQQVDQEKEPRSIHQQATANEAQRQHKQQQPAQKQQVNGERVLSKQSQQQQQQQQRPLILRKLAGSSSQSSSSLNPLNTKQAPGSASKRRRIKTQLPVGLSSWFLGGIRDLDGRHWQLPAEVISRLAVNDVDFVGSGPQTTIKPVEPPSAGSVVIIERDSQVGGPVQPVVGGEPMPAVVAATIPRVPISQLIPRR